MDINRAIAGAAAEVVDLQKAAEPCGAMPEVLAGWAAPHYFVAVRQELEAAPQNMDRLKLLRQLVLDAVMLQRGRHWACLPKLQRDRLEFDERKHKDMMEVLLAKPKVQERMNALRPLTDEERQAIVDTADEIMGLK